MRVYHPTKREETSAQWRSSAAARKVLMTAAVITAFVLALFSWPLYDCAGRPLLTMTGTVTKTSFIGVSKWNMAAYYRVSLSTPLGNLETRMTEPVPPPLPVLATGQRVNISYQVGRSGHVYLDHVAPPDSDALHGKAR